MSTWRALGIVLGVALFWIAVFAIAGIVVLAFLQRWGLLP